MTGWLPDRVGDVWTWNHPDGIQLVIQQAAPSGNGLPAWVELRWLGNHPAPGILTAARFDLMGSRTASTIAGAMRRLDLGDGWQMLIQAAIYDVVHDHLEGPLPTPLHTVDPKSASFILRPLVGNVGSTSIVGAGSVGKSMLALAASCAIASGNGDWIGMKVQEPGPVMYVDWEADANTHAARLHALAAANNHDIPEQLYYIAAEAPLRMWGPSLARRAATAKARLIVIDSVMLARGGEAKVADTVQFYASLRNLPCPTLLVDHQSREAITEGKDAAFGSVTNENSARLMWIMRGAEGHVTLKAFKANNYGALPRIHLKLDTTGDMDQLHTAQWIHVDAPPPTSGSTWDRIRQELTEHPSGFTIHEFASRLGVDSDTIGRTLRRYRAKGDIEDMDGTWMLVT